MKIAIASDHAGYKLKNIIINKFQDLFSFTDFGCDNDKDSIDYPDISKKLCSKYLSENFDFGILICGSGIGVSISANKVKNIRAALCHNEETAKLSRQHNNANILCLGARIIDEELAIQIVKSFLDSKFLAGRHLSRIEKIE